jgi:16S rRNA (guanine527-N7)-methyltransferase
VKKVAEWNERMNLIQEDTLKDIINRHVVDSLQIIPIIQETHKIHKDKLKEVDTKDISLSPHPIDQDEFINYKFDEPSNDIKQLKIIDVGTGAGFPGMILAICGLEGITLCDTNERKCIFLEEVSRFTNTKVQILNSDIELVDDKYDYILSRAYTSLSFLMKIASKLSRNSDSYGLFHKGKTWRNEVIESRSSWNFEINVYKSITASESVIIACNNINERS